MINYDKVAEKIFAIIKGFGYDLSMFTIDGMDTSTPSDGRRFYVKKPNFMVTLDEENDEVKINKNSRVTLEEIESVLKQLKNLAKQNLLNTQIKVFGKEITPKDFAYQAQKYKESAMKEAKEDWGKRGSIWDSEGRCKKCKRWPDGFDPRDATYGNICEYCDGDGWDFDAMDLAWGAPSSEGGRKIRSTKSEFGGIREASLSRMSGSKKTSYQTLESVKMIVRHRKPVAEEVRGSRSRQISAIFLEQGGERVRFPHNNLIGARAMARHMYEGGNFEDNIGSYIIESVDNILKLHEFVRYARSNKLMNETNTDVVKTVKENMAVLRKELLGLTGAKTYAVMSEAISSREASVLEEDDMTELQDMFTIKKFDEKLGDTLPLVRKLMNEKQAWRNALIEASTQTIFMHEKEELAEDELLEFDNPVQQVGYKIKRVANRMVETGDLQRYVGKIAGKLIEGEAINEFETTIIRNVLENAKVEEENECDVCDDCGCADCECDDNTFESILEGYALKIKMIEHEEIFTEDDEDNAALRNLKKGREDRKTNVPDHSGVGAGKVREDESEEELDEEYTLDTEEVENMFTPELVSEWIIEYDLKPEGWVMDTETYKSFADQYAMHDVDDMDGAGFYDFLENFLGSGLNEGEGDTCIRCRKGTMEVGDTMMGTAERCNRCGYQQQVNEAGKRYGKPSHPALRKLGDKKWARKFIPGLGKREAGERYKDEEFSRRMYGDDWKYDDAPEGEEEHHWKDFKSSEAGSRRYGRVAQGEHPFREDEWHSYEDEDTPPKKPAGEDCETCGGWGEVSTSGKHWRDISHLDDIVSCPDCKWVDPAGGIHDVGEEDPAKMYEMDDRMRKLAGLPIVEVADPAAADECPVCKGDGNAQDSIFDDDDCEECGGTGIVESITESDAEKAGSGNVDPEDFMDDCPDCGGSGENRKSQDSSFPGLTGDCERCNGEGYV